MPPDSGTTFPSYSPAPTSPIGSYLSPYMSVSLSPSIFIKLGLAPAINVICISNQFCDCKITTKILNIQVFWWRNQKKWHVHFCTHHFRLLFYVLLFYNYSKVINFKSGTKVLLLFDMRQFLHYIYYNSANLSPFPTHAFQRSLPFYNIDRYAKYLYAKSSNVRSAWANPCKSPSVSRSR